MDINQAKQKAQAHGWELRENIGGGQSAALVPNGDRPNPHTLVFPSIDQAIAHLEKQS